MKAEDLRAYAFRRWDLVEQAKDRFVADRFRTRGPAATFTAAVALSAHATRVMGRPSDERRRADLAHHVELKRKLERVTRVLEDR